MAEELNRSILVVDDTESSRYAISRYLQKAGFEVWEAATGCEALRLAEKGPDLITLDVRLPDLAGFEVCRRLKNNAQTAGIPVLEISAAFRSTADRVKGLDSGADGYLTGPVDPDELLANVKLLLRLRESERHFRQQAQLLELARDAIIVRDLDNRIQFWNCGAEESYGWSRAEAVGQVMHELLKTQFPAPLEMMTAQLLRDGIWQGVLIHETRAGKRRMVDSRWGLRRDERGEPMAVLVINRDITEQKQAEEALRATTHELQKAQELLRQHAAELESKVQQRTAELAQANEQLQGQIEERQRVEQSRAALLRQLVNAQEDERGRISRELHDEMGQYMAALLLKLKALADSLPGNARARKFLPSVQKLADLMGEQLHRIAFDLRPAALDDLGLVSTLRNYVATWSERTKVKVDFQTAGQVDQRLSREIETTLYRVVQEALNNVMKHSKATRVDLILEYLDGQVQAIVEDNGRGFDLDRVRKANCGGARLGLAGMKERLGLVGGTFSLESNSGRGTTVFARIPLNPV